MPVVRGADIPNLDEGAPPAERVAPARRVVAAPPAPAVPVRQAAAIRPHNHAARRRGGRGSGIVLFLVTFFLAGVAFLALWPAPRAEQPSATRTNARVNGARPASAAAAKKTKAATPAKTAGGSRRSASAKPRSGTTTSSAVPKKREATTPRAGIGIPSLMDNFSRNLQRVARYVKRVGNEAAVGIGDAVKSLRSQ